MAESGCQQKSEGGGCQDVARTMWCNPRETLEKIVVDGNRDLGYTVSMMNTTEGKRVVNVNGKSINVGASGFAVCGNCTDEHHPDDMKYDGMCYTCHNDIHCDDWTLDDI